MHHSIMTDLQNYMNADESMLTPEVIRQLDRGEQ
jgi:hypothetical protein